ncbi:EscJ/YscJ/HrcJ family type III secretion inner membrane ring protein [Chromobacterium sp. ATCC 53434]|uniref:type III secretion system inner membrane ring lipoprotein SctJ n=1 Tax=Chromobacterium TaxID=535 RepID=UPI000C78DE70|nr:type III secretion inner membrane ring lipoprotein SctJ [Chromobacterium sp. ATCC 53434]AUH50663.1 EscJ/YscJ/HrcJ family type III secretion inner membrane ring protein [Chromobacterium sp. ATCC 53434]
MNICRRLWPLLILLCLVGCKVDLYSGLSEDEANQMLALLMLRDVDAEKKIIKEGNVAIRVEKEQFTDAVEVLRQHGLPGKRTETMADLFPSGQLVTSPAQEQAKISYLKEQLLEKMLRGMDGVVSAQVSIAESASQNRREPPAPSASVFIKYSPGINMQSRETDIRRLIHNGVPNLRSENISVVLQAADYRYRPAAAAQAAQAPQSWWRAYAIWLAGGLTLLGCAAAIGVLAWRRRAAAS